MGRTQELKAHSNTTIQPSQRRNTFGRNSKSRTFEGENYFKLSNTSENSIFYKKQSKSSKRIHFNIIRVFITLCF